MSGRDGRAADLEASFEEYVAARRQSLLRTAFLMSGSADDAEDLVQLALVKAWPHWAKLADERGAATVTA